MQIDICISKDTREIPQDNGKTLLPIYRQPITKDRELEMSSLHRDDAGDERGVFSIYLLEQANIPNWDDKKQTTERIVHQRLLAASRIGAKNARPFQSHLSFSKLVLIALSLPQFTQSSPRHVSPRTSFSHFPRDRTDGASRVGHHGVVEK